MEERLQGLLDRIRSEGVERAQAEAAAIVDEAKARAAATIAAAEAEAAEIRGGAEADARKLRERSEKALEQTSRDYLLALQKSIEAVLRESLAGEVGAALAPEVIPQMLVRLAEAYARHDMNESRIDVLLSPEDHARVAEIVMAEYRELVGQGLTLHPDESIRKGFKVSFVDDTLYHDFTLPALVDALAPLLKAPLSDIVRRVPGKQG